MANKPISMLKIKRVLQLIEKGISQRRICRELQMGRGTFGEYQARIGNSGLSIKSLLQLSDCELSELLSPERPRQSGNPRKALLDQRLSGYLEELKRIGVTRRLLWEEYRKEDPNGYGYAQFCEHLSHHQKSQNLTYHNIHDPGDVLQVDFAGDPLYLTDRLTGEKTAYPVLVCSLPSSSFTYVEALRSAKQELFYNALNNSLSYIGGVPRRILSDNMKQYVIRADRYEPTFNEAAEQWAVHYNTELSATRVRKPKDKANVERHVNIVYQQVYARMRHEVFYTIEELNNRILELLDELNHKPMQLSGQSRYDQFVTCEKPVLGELPSSGYVFKYRHTVTVNSTYHVLINEDKHFYSVPHQYFGEKVSIVYDHTTIEIYHGYRRIATHKRSFVSHGYSTMREHMPENHKAYAKAKEYNAAYFKDRAEKIGPYTLIVITGILQSRQFIQQSYNSCNGLLGLTRKYPESRIEAACKRAAQSSVVNYQMIKSILEKNLDKLTEQELQSSYIESHNNIRGPESYN